jgi:hypothetical protein
MQAIMDPEFQASLKDPQKVFFFFHINFFVDDVKS